MNTPIHLKQLLEQRDGIVLEIFSEGEAYLGATLTEQYFGKTLVNLEGCLTLEALLEALDNACKKWIPY